MKSTFTPYLKKKYPNDKFGRLSIRITKDRKSEYITILKNFQTQFWDKKRLLVKNNYDEQEKLNQVIKDKIEQLKNERGIIELKSNSNPKSFFSFFESELNNLLLRKQHGLIKKYKTLYFHLKDYVKKRSNSDDLLFTDIDVLFVRDFETFLLSKQISNNSYKTYIRNFRTLFRLSLKLNLFYTSQNPFILFKNTIVETQKESLRKIDIEKIIMTEFEKNSELYHIKNYFLFQIFSQGLRVSDLLTLRWGNINSKSGYLIFTQYKTKHTHNVLINEKMVFILKDYIDIDTSKIINQRYKYKFNSGVFKGDYSLNLKDAINHFNKNKPKVNEYEIYKVDIEKYNKVINLITFKVYSLLFLKILEYAKEHQDEFIFPILDNKFYKEVVFNRETKLSRPQYNKISSRTTLYNLGLKELQSKCEIEINLTSHISRHSYSNMMLDIDHNPYGLQKSLGHKKFSTTENYINDLHFDIVSDYIDKMIDNFRII